MARRGAAAASVKGWVRRCPTAGARGAMAPAREPAVALAAALGPALAEWSIIMVGA